MLKNQKNLNMNIKWKDSARVKANVIDAYKFFEQIRKEKNGELDLDYAVEASRDKSAPLHDELEWDNKKAGHEYRKEQMRYIVRNVEIIRDDMNVPVRAYESIKVERIVSDDDDNRQKTRSIFLSTEDILKDEAGRAQLLGQAIRDAIAFRRRYSALSELATIITVIDSEIEKIGKEIII